MRKCNCAGDTTYHAKSLIVPVQSHTDWALFPYSAKQNPDIRVGLYTKDPGAYFLSQVKRGKKYIHFMTDHATSGEINQLLRQKNPTLKVSWTTYAYDLKERYTVVDIVITNR